MKKYFFGLEKDIFICFAYIPPASSVYAKNLTYDLIDDLSEEISKFQSQGNILIAGDFNAKTSTENDFVSDIDDKHSPIHEIDTYNCDPPIKRNNSDKHGVDGQGRRLLDLCKNSRVRILNGRFPGDRVGNLTRIPLSYRESPSTLDYMAADIELCNKISAFYVLPNTGISDHNCLCASIHTKFLSPSQETKIDINNSNKINFADPLTFELKLNTPIVRQKIDTWTTNARVNQNLTTNDLLESFNGLFTEVASKNTTQRSAKLKKRKKKKNESDKPTWFSNKCKTAKANYNRALKNYRRQPFNKSLQEILHGTKKQFKKVCRESENKVRRELTNKLLSVEKKNPREFWNLVNKMKNWGNANSDMSDNIPPSEWMSHFQSLLNDGHDAPPNLIDELSKCELTPNFTELDFRITDIEIIKALSKINGKASFGADQIPGELLKAGRKSLLPAYNLILNNIFSNASYPIIWAQHFLKPIFKNSDTYDPNNYRGIAIGSTFSKLFSLILLQRLEDWIKKYHPISVNQIGFREGHRTADHIFVLTTIINKIVKIEKKKLYVAFIDFRKAYDKINRTLLLLKLQKLGISGLFYRNIKAMYEQVYYLVKVKGGYLDPITSNIGLKQGGVLSSLLFNIYVDDIKDIFDDSCYPIDIFEKPLSHLLYADDLILMSRTDAGLNSCLQKLVDYCEKWHLEINVKKSKIVIFNQTGKILSGQNFQLRGIRLEVVQRYCYLGIEIACSGSFRIATTNLMDKANKAMFPLRSTISQFNIPCRNSLKLFHTMITPITLYCSEVWNYFTHAQMSAIEQNKVTLFTFMTNSEIGRTHQKFLKYLLGVNNSCSLTATLGELGEFPLMLYGFVRLLKFWHRTAKLSGNILVRQALDIQKRYSDQFEWLSSVKFILKLIGMDEHFDNPDNVTVDSFSKICLTKLKQICVKQWRMRLANESKLRFYRLFKTEFNFENYLEIVPHFPLRKVITKFRCSDHRLEIEIGRHRKIPINQRICKMCTSGIESEEHFLRWCPKLKQLRDKYLGHPINFIHWVAILKCSDKNMTFNLGNYINKALKLRTSLTENV